MSAEDLRRLIELASRTVEKLFRKQRFLVAMCHAVSRQQDHLIFSAEKDESKESFFGKIAAICESGNIVRYVFIDEAWIVSAKTPGEIKELNEFTAAGGAPRDHPRREEVVMFSAEDADGQMMARRPIIREPGQRPRLGPLTIDPMEGRIEGPLAGLFGRSDQFEVHWIDRGREPTGAPDPKYPHGIDIDLSRGRASCKTTLPYPAPRCGVFHVKCKRCGTDAMVTTTGRPDDPRSVTLACRLS